jgi:hypothetical protein
VALSDPFSLELNPAQRRSEPSRTGTGRGARHTNPTRERAECFTRRSLSLSTIDERLGIELGEALDKRLSDDDEKSSSVLRDSFGLRPIRPKEESSAAALDNRPDSH